MARRRFSPEFKRKVVEEYVRGGRSAAEICAQYQLHENLIYRWRKQDEAGGRRLHGQMASNARTAAGCKMRETEGRNERE